MSNPTDAKELVEAWREAMEGVTPGPWKWWTSCSWRRLSSAVRGFDRDGGVICPTVSRSDRHPDLIVSDDDMEWIARCSPVGVSALLALIEAQAADLARVKRKCGEELSARLVGEVKAETALAKAVADENEACARLAGRISEAQAVGWAENPTINSCGGRIAASNTGLFISQAIRARTAAQKDQGHEG